jgi:hypothetical protein
MYNAPDTARLEPLLEGLIYKRRIVDFGQFERRQWHKYKCKYKYKYKYNVPDSYTNATYLGSPGCFPVYFQSHYFLFLPHTSAITIPCQLHEAAVCR